MNLKSDKLEILNKYAELLNECKTARLTGTRGVDEIFKLQILDCVPSVEFLPVKPQSKIIDVGSGGGLPGIVWSIMRPDLKIILLDSIQKKCTAMQNIVNALNLNNVEIICGRVEELKDLRAKFDLASARAVGNLKLTLKLLTPLVKSGGRILTFKGAKLNDELNECNIKDWRKLNLTEPQIKYYENDNAEQDKNINSSRCVIFWDKIILKIKKPSR